MAERTASPADRYSPDPTLAGAFRRVKARENESQAARMRFPAVAAKLYRTPEEEITEEQAEEFAQAITAYKLAMIGVEDAYSSVLLALFRKFGWCLSCGNHEAEFYDDLAAYYCRNCGWKAEAAADEAERMAEEDARLISLTRGEW